MRDSTRMSRLRRSGWRLLPLALGVVLVAAPAAAAGCVKSKPRTQFEGPYTPPAPAGPRCTHSEPAAQIAARLAAGRPVIASRLKVRGVLRLPTTVSAPLVLRQSCFLGGVRGAHATFENLVDLSGSSFREGVDFTGAHFRGPLLLAGVLVPEGKTASFSYAISERATILSGAWLGGLATFDGAELDGTARFTGTEFAGPARFRVAIFSRLADFVSAKFDQGVTFADSELRSGSDFGSVQFTGPARFDGARFSGPAEFVGAIVAGPARFDRVRFEVGASFLSTWFVDEASFYLVRSGGDLDFDSAKFDRKADFSTAKLLGDTSFPHALLGGILELDQAFARSLDLRGARLYKFHLPEQRYIGGIRSLRLDPPDGACAVDGVSHEYTRAQQERALTLAEAAATADGDLGAANDAKIRLLSIERDARPFVPRMLDWAFWWGLLGYFVLPIHQLLLIGVVFVVAVTVRWLKTRGTLEDDVGGSLDSLLRLTPPSSAAAKVEYLVYKFLVVVLIVNVGNVWPPFRDLLKGVF